MAGKRKPIEIGLTKHKDILYVTTQCSCGAEVELRIDNYGIVKGNWARFLQKYDDNSFVSISCLDCAYREAKENIRVRIGTRMNDNLQFTGGKTEIVPYNMPIGDILQMMRKVENKFPGSHVAELWLEKE